ncbi:autotransporter outer membrane beta-barrel domain-containing protein [Pseudomonas sp. Irchel s3b2]|uniref:autotransporter outer membrane beta-barrel domain-containing protein n=1 Tax=Pseudomonas sp. Irchel s3b2 TaxID=2009073 RepID=UPI000BA32DC0|nr:autotransporter outer membrane beta-barrel domain-containing protein [Pseudomonas sp. Irchel s3b2]
MPIRRTFRPHYMALAISLALGHAASANAQQPTTILPSLADHMARIETLINDPVTVKTPVIKTESGSDGVALKLGDSNDLVTVSRRGRFNGVVDGGGGTNALQLDVVSGGELGESRNFNYLHVNRGEWTLTGTGDFSEGAIVKEKAALTNRGHIFGQVSVDKKATFRGNGQVGHLLVAGRLEVNAMHGAPRVSGNLELQNTAELAHEVNADGRSETIQVDGTAKLGNATLKIVAVPGEYPLSSQYTIIKAGKIEGEFGKVINDLAFMAPDFQYEKKTVGFILTRNDVPLESAAITENGREFANSIDEPKEIPQAELSSDTINNVSTAPTLPPDIETAATVPTPATETTVTRLSVAQTSTTASLAPPASETSGTAQAQSLAPQPTVAAVMPSTSTNAAINALLGANKATAARAIEQLAAGSNANLANATLSSVHPVSASMLAAMHQLDNPDGLSALVPRVAAGSETSGRLWVQALGSAGTLDRNRGGSTLQHSTKGLVLGADWAVDEQWRVGVMGGKSQTRLDGSLFNGDLDSWHLGAYALRQSGPLALRLGANHSNHDGSTKRRVAFNGFSDRPKGSYDASTQQAFTEIGHNLGSGNISAEPFANLGYQRYQRNSYTEKGGAAALQVHGQTQNNFSSTFGLRLAQLNTLDNGMQLTPRFSAGWKHTYGDVDSRTHQRLVTGGRTYTVEGAALDRDSLMLDAGLELVVSTRHTLGFGYNGEIGNDSRSHGVMGQWRMAF